MASDDKDLLSRKEAAQFLTKECKCKISPRTLANLASNENAGHGPPFIRSGWRTVSYEREDLKAWAAGRAVKVA